MLIRCSRSLRPTILRHLLTHTASPCSFRAVVIRVGPAVYNVDGMAWLLRYIVICFQREALERYIDFFGLRAPRHFSMLMNGSTHQCGQTHCAQQVLFAVLVIETIFLSSSYPHICIYSHNNAYFIAALLVCQYSPQTDAGPKC
jgi:hypothetical protein